MSNLKFNFSGESKSPTKFVGKSRNFQITIDEPPDLGGNDEAANPVEYTLASLAGCLNVVAYLIANELGFKINALNIDISGNLNPSKLLEGNNKDRAGFKDIFVKIKVDANADETVLKKWLRIVEERCPVTDNLVNPTQVDFGLNVLQTT